jgi:2-phospho-L-lactate guanylyltransferase (CobY/MobA/RfbA family)
MSSWFDDFDDTPPIKKRHMFVKNVRSASLGEALARIEDWGKSRYDMFLVKIDVDEDDFVEIIITGIENDYTREYYNV